MSIPPISRDLLTRADLHALSRMPADKWFSEFDLPPIVRCPRYRCDRLHLRGYLEYRVIGDYPHLEGQYRKKTEAVALEAKQ